MRFKNNKFLSEEFWAPDSPRLIFKIIFSSNLIHTKHKIQYDRWLMWEVFKSREKEIQPT